MFCYADQNPSGARIEQNLDGAQAEGGRECFLNDPTFRAKDGRENGALSGRGRPAHITPVAEEFGRLAFEGVADELENPSDHEKSKGIEPEAMEEEAGGEDCDREQDRGNPQGVAKAIDRILVAGRVLRDPLLAGTVA